MPQTWGFYNTQVSGIHYKSGQFSNSRGEKAAKPSYLTILTEQRKSKSDLTKVFPQTHKWPCPTAYIKQADWKKDVKGEGKFTKTKRTTFTEEVMAYNKQWKTCPGFYKDAEKPKGGISDKRIPGHYKQKAKQRIIWDEPIAAGKRTPGHYKGLETAKVSAAT